MTSNVGESSRRSRTPAIPDDVVVLISYAGQQNPCVAQLLTTSLEQARFHSFLDVRDLGVEVGLVTKQQGEETGKRGAQRT